MKDMGILYVCELAIDCLNFFIERFRLDSVIYTAIMINSSRHVESSSSSSCSADSKDAATSSAIGSGTRIPRVIKFAYKNFEFKGGKWSAVCSACSKTLTDKAGVSTAFTK